MRPPLWPATHRGAPRSQLQFSARHDKISLRVEHGLVVGPNLNQGLFARNMSHRRYRHVGNNDHLIFTGSPRPTGRIKFTTRKGQPYERNEPLTHPPIPVFHAEVVCWPTQRPDHGGAALSIQYYVYVNPLRFLTQQTDAFKRAAHAAGQGSRRPNYRHQLDDHEQEPFALRGEPAQQFYQRRPVLRREWLADDEQMPIGEEWSLDGGDNVLMTDADFLAAGTRIWPRITMLAIDGAIRELNQALSIRAEASNARFLVEHQKINILGLEANWEFHHPAAISAIRSFRPTLAAWTRARRESDYSGRDIEEADERNTVSLSSSLISGVGVAIYAKTNRRIRVEIRHTPQEIASGERTTRRVPAPTVDLYGAAEIYPWIDNMTRDAVRELRPVLEALTPDASAALGAPLPADLHAAVVAAAGGWDRGGPILELLFTRHQIDITGNPELGGVARRLAADGVLEVHHRHNRIYVPTEPYLALLHALEDFYSSRQAPPNDE